jgi:phage/plasmid-like protein (TIGR03299 family)
MSTIFSETLHEFIGKDITFKELVEQAGLDYEVEKCPLQAMRPNKWGNQIMDHIVATYRTDNGVIVSKRGVGRNYGIVQVRDALAFCDYLIKQNYAAYGYAGAPGGGAKAYVILKAEGAIKIGDKHSIENWFTVSTSHDGTGRIEVKVTPVFPLIGSVLVPDQGKHLSFRHTKNVRSRLTQALKTIKRVTSEWDNTEALIRKMTTVKIDDEAAKKYFTDVIGSEDIENSKRGLGIREHMMTLYKSGAYNLIPSMSSTVFGAYAAVLEWVDKEKTTRSSKVRTNEKEARLYTKIDGAAAKQKAKAHGFARKMCALHREDAYA